MKLIACVLMLASFAAGFWLHGFYYPPEANLYVGDWKWCLAPHAKPVLEFKDTETIIIHRPPQKWFTVSCLAWSDTYVRPLYGSKECNLEGIRPPALRNTPELEAQ